MGCKNPLRMVLKTPKRVENLTFILFYSRYNDVCYINVQLLINKLM
jgi:hypothetical protein